MGSIPIARSSIHIEFNVLQRYYVCIKRVSRLVFQLHLKRSIQKKAKTVPVVDVSGQTRSRKEDRPRRARKVHPCCLRKLHNRLAATN
jgi:hypothetical protein